MADLPTRKGWSIALDPIFGCWLWTGRLDRDGYGVIYNRTGPSQAHRAVYLELVGPIGEGLRLDHECRRRRCVRPEHLEPVTESINQGRRTWRARVRRSQCRNGHDLAINAMVTPEGGRLCRVCQGARP